MLPDPLHPAIVHFPIVLAILVPVALLGLLYRITRRKGEPARPTWAVAVALTAMLAGSAWLALQTGERDEDRVEEVVSESAIHTHEERAEQFLLLTVAVFGVSAIGLSGRRIGHWARYASAIGSLLVIPAGYLVGHSGGELVYRHGAAQAYAEGGPGAGADSGARDGDRDGPARRDGTRSEGEREEH